MEWLKLFVSIVFDCQKLWNSLTSIHCLSSDCLRIEWASLFNLRLACVIVFWVRIGLWLSPVDDFIFTSMLRMKFQLESHWNTSWEKLPQNVDMLHTSASEASNPIREFVKRFPERWRCTEQSRIRKAPNKASLLKFWFRNEVLFSRVCPLYFFISRAPFYFSEIGEIQANNEPIPGEWKPFMLRWSSVPLCWQHVFSESQIGESKVREFLKTADFPLDSRPLLAAHPSCCLFPVEEIIFQFVLRND